MLICDIGEKHQELETENERDMCSKLLYFLSPNFQMDEMRKSMYGLNMYIQINTYKQLICFSLRQIETEMKSQEERIFLFKKVIKLIANSASNINQFHQNSINNIVFYTIKYMKTRGKGEVNGI